MEIRLNDSDYELLDTGQRVTSQLLKENPNYSYLGGSFGTNPNDYVEVLIHDINENFLESVVADRDDYEYNENTGVKLNTGTILRKAGYDAGKYVIKYNFLRPLAGSDETVLVDSQGNIHKDFHRMENTGKIMSGTEHSDSSVELFIKENKYFIQEISATRSEVRVFPQNINDNIYRDDFLSLQTGRRKIEIKSGLKFKTDAQGNQNAGTSQTLILTDKTLNLPVEATGGNISLNKSFIESIIPLPSTNIEGERSEEIDTTVDNLQARFIISEEESNQYQKGDTNFVEINRFFQGKETFDFTTKHVAVDRGFYPIFFKADDPDNTFNENITLSRRPPNKNDIRGISSIPEQFNRPNYNRTQDERKQPVVLTFRSISAKPLNVNYKYTWEFFGWDKDGGEYGALINRTGDSGDLLIRDPGGDAQVKGLRVSGTQIQEVTVELYAGELTVGVGLKLERDADQSSSEVIYPACLYIN